MKNFLFVFGLIFLFTVQEAWAQPTGRRTDVTTLSTADKNALATAMLGYIDADIISEHSCNTEFGGGGAGSIHGPEMFLNWHRNYLAEMEEAIAADIALIPSLNGLLPRWTHADGLPTVSAFTVVDADCAAACGDDMVPPITFTLTCAAPAGTGSNNYPFPNPLVCTTWADFVTFSENLRTTYHNNGHGVLGGVMGNFKSPASPIFWLWHAMIDDVYWDFQDECINGGELYMQDAIDDTGIEPYGGPGLIYLSPDIWVRKTQDMATGGTTIPHGSTSYLNEGMHENPEYYLSDDNYVYVRIRNTGTDEFAGGRLRVYWSKASTGLSWPTTWVNYSIGGLQYGDEITPDNPTGASTQANPSGTPHPTEANLILPPIPPGGQFIMEIPWHVPDPNLYPTDIHHFCLLARILSPVDDMTFTEVSSVATNVRNNNNIAWRNVEIYDAVVGNIVDPGNTNPKYLARKLMFMGVYATNPYPVEHRGHFLFQARKADNGRNFYDIGGVVYARMDMELFELWAAAGFAGGGIERIGELNDKMYVKITDPYAKMSELTLPPRSNYAIEMAYGLTKYVSPGQQYDYDIHQHDEDGFVGGERYEIRLVETTGNRRNAIPELLDVAEISITPNPASDEFTVAYNLKEDGQVTMALYDIDGRLVNQFAAKNHLAGSQNQLVNVADMNPGIYILRVQIDQQVINKKIVIE